LRAKYLCLLFDWFEAVKFPVNGIQLFRASGSEIAATGIAGDIA